MASDLEDQKLEISAQEALQKLIQGNERFVRGEARLSAACKESLADLVKGQSPFATILGCSDSRVPPELIFDAGFGDLFIIRVAGNVMSQEVRGSMQYAAAHLRTPLFIILGHEGCGAVQAALQFWRDGQEQRPYIQTLVENIAAGLAENGNLSANALLAEAVRANVQWVVKQILGTPGWQNATAAGMQLLGAIYHIQSGTVEFLNP